MFQQGSELLVRLTESIRHPAGANAHLHRRLDTVSLEEAGELLVAHQGSLGFLFRAVQPKLGNEVALAVHHLVKMLGQHGHVEFNGRVRIHTQDDIDDTQFLCGEAPLHLLEELVRKLHVVDAVGCVAFKFFCVEVCTAFAQCIDHLVALRTKCIVGDESFQTTTYTDVVQRTRHGERVQPELRLDTKVPRQDGPIEGSVVA